MLYALSTLHADNTPRVPLFSVQNTHRTEYILAVVFALCHFCCMMLADLLLFLTLCSTHSDCMRTQVPNIYSESHDRN
jgi:hypothetical protein